MTTLNCATYAPAPAVNRVYHQCWGNREFPATMSFTAGPSTPIPPYTTCNTGWPAGVITGTLNRTGVCDFAWSYSAGSFAIIFAWTAGGQPLSCSIDQAELYPGWSVANATGTSPTGSCSQDPVTGVVTLTFTATISDGFCTCPVTITYSG